MDSRVVGGVGGSGFHSHARRAVCAVADDLGVVAHKGCSKLGPPWFTTVESTRLIGVVPPVNTRKLPIRSPGRHPPVRRHHPRICSEADVTHGYGVESYVARASLRTAGGRCRLGGKSVVWHVSRLPGRAGAVQGRHASAARGCGFIAAAWREASARAFAVRRTSSMDAGGRRCFGRGSRPARRLTPSLLSLATYSLLRPVCVERPHVISAVNYAHWRVNAATRTLQYQGVRVRLHCIPWREPSTRAFAVSASVPVKRRNISRKSGTRKWVASTFTSSVRRALPPNPPASRQAHFPGRSPKGLDNLPWGPCHRGVQLAGERRDGVSVHRAPAKGDRYPV